MKDTDKVLLIKYGEIALRGKNRRIHENILLNASYVLQKRALRLQQTKQKAALHREQQRELQLQRETDLIAKPVSSYSEKEKSS